MPKHDIILKPGENPPRGIKGLLKKMFTKQELEKLEKFGGRIQISLAAPYTNRKKQDQQLEIDDMLIKKMKSDPNFAKEKLKMLTVKQMRIIAKKIKLPVASKATASELRNNIMDFISSGNKWKGISGT